MKCAFILLIAAVCLAEISAHGYMENPWGRVSKWRDWKNYPDALPDYNDMEYFCGGFLNQTNIYGGKCGICGDSYGDPIPRKSEHQGKYGDGTIVKTYKSGEVITVGIQLTANHLGLFSYQLCKLNNENDLETDDCFEPLKMADGSNAYQVVDADNMLVENRVQLPAGFTCEHCVLRWHYHCGNSYGLCDNGQIELGCGPQETFRACADIKIV